MAVQIGCICIVTIILFQVLDNVRYWVWYNINIQENKLRYRAYRGEREQGRWSMNPQFKKGVLEMVVLVAVSRKDMYGYELVAEVSRVIDVNEGDYLSAFEASDE